MLAKLLRYSSELDLTAWEHCVIYVANIMIKMMNRGGGLHIDDHGQIWDRIPPEPTETLQLASVIQAGEGSDTSKHEGGKGKKKNQRRKNRNRNRKVAESQPSSTQVLSEEPTEPSTESTLYTLGTTTFAAMPPDLLVGTPSSLSRHSVGSQDVAAEIRGALTLSKIMNVADIQPSGEHPNKGDKASARKQGEFGTATEGTSGSFEHRGKTSGTSRRVRADIDAVP
jgi:hypothetical protein